MQTIAYHTSDMILNCVSHTQLDVWHTLQCLTFNLVYCFVSGTKRMCLTLTLQVQSHMCLTHHT